MVKTTNQLRSAGLRWKSSLLDGRGSFLFLSPGWVKISILSPDFFACENRSFTIKEVELRSSYSCCFRDTSDLGLDATDRLEIGEGSLVQARSGCIQKSIGLTIIIVQNPDIFQGHK